MAIDPAGIPVDLGSETTPANLTHYLGIDLHNGLSANASHLGSYRSKTAVYFPDPGKVNVSQVDVILYLQGYTTTLPIDVFLKDPAFPLRERIGQSTRKAFIFVAPTLRGELVSSGDKKFKVAQAGDLARQPANYLQQVLNGLQAHGPFGQTPTLGQVVLAAHSAGGQHLFPIAKALGKKVSEIWCFDCFYGGYAGTGGVKKPEWITWLESNTQVKRFWIYALGGTKANSEALKRAGASLSGVEVTVGGTWQNSIPSDHDHIPETFLKSLVDTSVLS